MTSNTFCRHLSNGYRIYIKNGKITWLPCCYWEGSALPFKNLEQHRTRLNISTPWAHQECNKCHIEEAYKTSGYRAAGNGIIPELPDSKVGWLDIQADMTCNGGCLICGPWSSSYWQNELAKYNEYVIAPIEKNLQPLVDEIFQALDTSELRLLQFLGGEPFLSKVDQYALQHIVNPHICKLKYTTNGSVYPKSTRINQWRNFKEVLINLSIDGVGDRFDYLRYPLKWNQVEDNIKKLINEPLDNIKFHINHTVTPLNIYYYDEFLDWVDSTFPKERFTGIHTHTAYGVMSVAGATDGIRAKVLNKYGADHMLWKMLESNKLQNSNFWTHINLWDHRRSTNWQTTFPDII